MEKKITWRAFCLGRKWELPANLSSCQDLFTSFSFERLNYFSTDVPWKKEKLKTWCTSFHVLHSREFSTCWLSGLLHQGISTLILKIPFSMMIWVASFKVLRHITDLQLLHFERSSHRKNFYNFLKVYFQENCAKRNLIFSCQDSFDKLFVCW